MASRDTERTRSGATEEDRRRRLAALDRIEAHGNAILKRRGGQPLEADVAELIQAMREERDEESVRNSRSLEEVIGKISRNAQRRGLTPEILDELLNEP
jgi:hypothetical protein